MHAGGHPCTLGVQAVTPGHWPAVHTHLTDEEAEGQTQTPTGRWAASEAGADTAGPPQAAAPGQPGSLMLTSLPPSLTPRSPSPPPNGGTEQGAPVPFPFILSGRRHSRCPHPPSPTRPTCASPTRITRSPDLKYNMSLCVTTVRCVRVAASGQAWVPVTPNGGGSQEGENQRCPHPPASHFVSLDGVHFDTSPLSGCSRCREKQEV